MINRIAGLHACVCSVTRPSVLASVADVFIGKSRKVCEITYISRILSLNYELEILIPVDVSSMWPFEDEQ